jgi:hypothetical protein
MSEAETQLITWERLIEDTEREIEVSRKRLAALQRSLRFFRKRAATGIAFPVTKRQVPDRLEKR